MLFLFLFDCGLYFCCFYRSIKVENLSKRMSNSSLCMTILTDLIGFDKTNDGERISLPDEVEVDTLVQFKEDFIKSSNETKLSENKELEDCDTFWSCNHCNVNNEIDLAACTMCGSPKNVCILISYFYFMLSHRSLSRWHEKNKHM